MGFNMPLFISRKTVTVVNSSCLSDALCSCTRLNSRFSSRFKAMQLGNICSFTEMCFSVRQYDVKTVLRVRGTWNPTVIKAEH